MIGKQLNYVLPVQHNVPTISLAELTRLDGDSYHNLWHRDWL